VDTTQMRETLGFVPKFTTAEAFRDFARSRGPGLLPPERIVCAVDRLSDAVIPAGSNQT
jgi:UDP-glucose 4-epimerase